MEPLKGLRSIVPVCSSLVRNSKMAKRHGICDAVGRGVYQGTRNNSFKPRKLVFKWGFFLAFYCGVVLSRLGSVSGGDVDNNSSSSQELNATPSDDIGSSKGTPVLQQEVLDEVAKELDVIAQEIDEIIAKRLFGGANMNAQEASKTKALGDAKMQWSKIASMFGDAKSGLGAAAEASYRPVKKLLGRGAVPDTLAARKFIDDQGWWEGMFPLMVAAVAYEATKRIAGRLTSTEGKSAARSDELEEFAERAQQTETEEDLGSSVD